MTAKSLPFCCYLEVRITITKEHLALIAIEKVTKEVYSGDCKALSYLVSTEGHVHSQYIYTNVIAHGALTG